MSEMVFEKWWETAEASTQREAAFLAWAAALEWAAQQAEAAGCACKTLCIDHDWDGEFNGTLYYTKPGGALIDGRTSVARHDSRCPSALAAKIREGAP